MSDGFFFPAPSAAGSAPDVEDGLALARFTDLRLVEHPDWAVERDNYGHPDSGDRYHFIFALVDETGEQVYNEADGEPIMLERLTRTATGKRSKFREVMEGLLTPQELTLFLAATPDAPFDGSKVRNRVYNVKIQHTSNGWPVVGDVIGIAKGVK